MSEPLKPLWSLVERMLAFEETSGWADELEAQLRVWDERFRSLDEGLPEEDVVLTPHWVRERVLGVAPKGKP